MYVHAGYGFIESFNGRMRDELLNETLFTSLAQAQQGTTNTGNELKTG